MSNIINRITVRGPQIEGSFIPVGQAIGKFRENNPFPSASSLDSADRIKDLKERINQGCSGPVRIPWLITIALVEGTPAEDIEQVLHPDVWLVEHPDVVADVKAIAQYLDSRVLQQPPGLPQPNPLQTVDQVLAGWGAKPSDPHYAGMRRRLGHFSQAIIADDWDKALVEELNALADEAAPAAPSRPRARL